MTRLFNRIKWILVLIGLASVGLNFTNPKLAQESAKAITSTVKAVTEAPDSVVKSRPQKSAEPLYVQIDKKLYKYNPSGVYTVDGVRMLYKNGHPRTAEELGLSEDAAEAATGRAGAQVDQMLMNGAHTAYTPEGVQKIMDGAREAKAKIDQRNRELEEMMK